MDDIKKGEGGIEDIPSDVNSLLQMKQKFLWNCSPGQVFGIGPQYGKRATMVFASGDQTFLKVDESLLTGAMLSKINVVADKSTICKWKKSIETSEIINLRHCFISVLIPHIPLSFNCLSVNRRDGSCIPHSSGQVNFSRIIQSSINSIAQLAADKCNQNYDARQSLNSPTVIDRMSQSVYDTCHHIFDEQENLQIVEPQQQHHSQHYHLYTSPHRTGGKRSRRHDLQQKQYYEKILPQLAFELDRCYGILWVFDAIEKRFTIFNVIASELPQNPDCLSHLKAIFLPELTLPQRCDMPIAKNLAATNLLACLDILTAARDVM